MAPMRITVLLPARNAQATIGAAVRSVLAQTVRDFELLAIDDGSTDGTGALLDALAREDERVRVLHTGGAGLVAALNLGLREARAPLLARMDADDECLPERFAFQIQTLEATATLAGVGTGVTVTRDDRPPSPNLIAYAAWLSSLTSPELVRRDCFIESPLCHPSVMLRTHVLREAGGWRDGPFPEDYELWLRLLDAGHSLSCVPQVLLRWRDSDDRVTRTDARCSPANHLALKATYLARRLGRTPVTLWGATDTGRALCRLLQANEVQVLCFLELNPRKLGQTIHGAPVLHPDALPDDGSHVLSCVAAKGARDEIRRWLTQRGMKELQHFTCVA